MRGLDTAHVGEDCPGRRNDVEVQVVVERLRIELPGRTRDLGRGIREPECSVAGAIAQGLDREAIDVEHDLLPPEIDDDDRESSLGFLSRPCAMSGITVDPAPGFVALHVRARIARNDRQHSVGECDLRLITLPPYLQPWQPAATIMVLRLHAKLARAGTKLRKIDQSLIAGHARLLGRRGSTNNVADHMSVLTRILRCNVVDSPQLDVYRMAESRLEIPDKLLFVV